MILLESEKCMNVEELGYYLFMQNEEAKEKEELTEEEKVNLELNPFFIAEKATKNQYEK